MLTPGPSPLSPTSPQTEPLGRKLLRHKTNNAWSSSCNNNRRKYEELSESEPPTPPDLNYFWDEICHNCSGESNEKRDKNKGRKPVLITNSSSNFLITCGESSRLAECSESEKNSKSWCAAIRLKRSQMDYFHHDSTDYSNNTERNYCNDESEKCRRLWETDGEQDYQEENEALSDRWSEISSQRKDNGRVRKYSFFSLLLSPRAPQ